MSLPRFIYSKTDGLTSTTQIALKPIPNMQELWDNFLIPFFQKKRDATGRDEFEFSHEEIVDFHPCKSVRKIRFLYDDSPGSFEMFQQLIRFENPELTTIYQLVPIHVLRTEEELSFEFPRLVDTSTGDNVTLLDLAYDESPTPFEPFLAFKYVYITQTESRINNEVFLKPVDEHGIDVFYQLLERMYDYFDRAQTDRTLVFKEKHELVDHVDCAHIMRYFLHYDKSEESRIFLFRLLSTRMGSTMNTLRITLVPRTAETEALLRKVNPDGHYPCLINAASRTIQKLVLHPMGEDDVESI